MLDGDELTVLEANAIPGLTDTSLLPLAAEAAGIGFDDVRRAGAGARRRRGRRAPDLTARLTAYRRRRSPRA